jgi:hypothetical protein
VRLVVYVTDMFRFRPIVNKIQAELWGQGPYPPRTIVEVHRLNQDDIVEIEGTFYAPSSKRAQNEPVAARLGSPRGQELSETRGPSQRWSMIPKSGYRFSERSCLD